MPTKKLVIYSTFYFPSKVIQLLCSVPRWWLLRHYSSILYLTVVPVVSGFQVTQRSHHGDDIFGYMNDVKYAAYTTTGKQKEQPLSFVLDDVKNTTNVASTAKGTTSAVKLVPLSTKPLLLVSSGSPVLSSEDCQHLSSYFLAKTRPGNKENDEKYPSSHPGRQVLEKLQAILDELILRSENTIVEPRYLFYEKPTLNDRRNIFAHHIDSTIGDTTTTNNPIFPDGLHVDTNNGKYFRYCTVLVYLTSSHAATVFPLANIQNYNQIVACPNEVTYHHKKLQDAAECLIQNHIQHTRQKIDVEPPLSSSYKSSEQNVNEREDMLRQKFIRDIQKKQNLIENAVSRSSSLRIVPQMGHIAIFFNINPQTGYADPYSFHGSEVSFDEKQVLTFFYELLPNTEHDIFHTPVEFGQQIQKRIHRMQQKYVVERLKGTSVFKKFT